jgi:hypothetical protein
MLLMIAVLGLGRYRQFTVPGLGLASFLAIVGAWAKRYLIVVPTLSSPFLPIQRVPETWAHYSPTWVEWSITASAFAAFLLLYTMLIKFFPVVSVWETRPEIEVAATQEPSGFGPLGWGPAVRTSVLVIVLVLAGAGLLRAGQAPAAAESPQPASLTLSWKALPATEEPRIEDARTDPVAPSAGRVLAYSKPFQLPWSQPDARRSDAALFPAIEVAALLRNVKGQPLMYQPVAFALKTMFGTVDFGSRPTDDDGKVSLVIHDRRLGSYPVTVSYSGDSSNTPIRAQAVVDFGIRPKPALPASGVLVGPGFSPEIGLPFLCFYGGMWCVFAYCVGYLTLWRMRLLRARSGETPDSRPESS